MYTHFYTSPVWTSRKLSFIFWGTENTYFVFHPIRLKQALSVTYQQDYNGMESRLHCSQGGRNSPGTSHSWHHLCYPGSWYSGPHGQWNGTVQGQSSTPVIDHCSHRLLAKTYESSQIHVLLMNNILKDSQKTKHNLPHSLMDRWWQSMNDHQRHC